MKEINTDNFEKEVLQSKTPVLVDFWAPWCGPCRIVGPVLEKISSEYKNKLNFAKFNVDDGQETAAKFDVRGIPCMIIFKNGKELDRLVGAFPEPVLRQKIDSILANA
ncbi:MAG TPA: thioredoxin [Candidatus Nanoarchaeia archaeon]|nr:thioredoxin [Candidatus Nanoarchaeia archaeon]